MKRCTYKGEARRCADEAAGCVHEWGRDWDLCAKHMDPSFHPEDLHSELEWYEEVAK